MTTAAATQASRHVIIVGGGIAGLAAALRCRALDSAIGVTIVESAPAIGGKIAGQIVKDCVVDGGADVCIGDRMRTTHLFAELGLEEHALRVNPQGLPVYEWNAGRLQRSALNFAGELLTFRGGIREIVNRTCDALERVSIATDTQVIAIRFAESGFRLDCSDGRSPMADAVILATSASVAADLLPAISAHTASALRGLAYPATTTVTMAWHHGDVPRVLDGTGYLATDPVARMSACTWTSAKIPSHAPADVALLRGYIRGTDGDPAAVMREEVASVLGIAAPPLFTRIYKWASGIPVYPPAHNDTVRGLTRELSAMPGLFIAGSAFHGVGIPDCIHSGERAAADAISYVQSRRTEASA